MSTIAGVASALIAPVVLACVVAAPQMAAANRYHRHGLAPAVSTVNVSPGIPLNLPPIALPVMVVEVSLETFDVSGLGDDLPWTEREPGGLEVPATANPAWAQLGLRTGDIIERIDSSPVTRSPSLTEGLTVYDVWRAGKRIQLRIVAHGALFRTAHVTDADLGEVMDMHKDPTDRFSTPLKRSGVASGVRIIQGMLTVKLDLNAGDIVRSIGSRAINSEDALVEAIQNLAVGHTDALVERDGRLITITFEREPPDPAARP